MNLDFFKYILALLIFGSNGIVASFIALTSYEIVFFRTMTGALFLILLFIGIRKKTAVPGLSKRSPVCGDLRSRDGGSAGCFCTRRMRR